MGKQSNGPDWVDVFMYVRALDVLHGSSTVFTIMYSGPHAISVASVAITSRWPVLPGSQQLAEITTTKGVVTAELSTLAAVVYNGLYTHDFAIGQAYQQRNIQEA
jgi:hypothetical protein